MRKILTLVAMMALAGCGGGGGGGTAPQPPAPATTAPQGDLVTPTFTINIPPRGSSANVRTPNRVSSAALSVTITRTTQPTVLPTSKTTDLTTLVPCPCTVNGPPSPPGVSNTFTIQTFASTNGSGTALDTGSVTFTPTAGVNNPQTVTLMGIPKTVTITNVPAAFNAGGSTPGSPATATLAITVKDAAGVTIASGTYANNITVTDPDANGTQGSQLTGTNPGTCPPGTCVVMTGPADTATLNYGGLAEDPVTLSATGSGVTTGTATFTAVLQAITLVAGGPTTTLAGGGPGIDLFTTDNTSPIGYSGTISYSEAGYTTTPYNRTLTTINGTSCAAFASESAVDNTGAGQTDFTETASSNTAGSCTRVVSDGLALAGHGAGGTSFRVSYTTSSVQASSKHRHK